MLLRMYQRMIQRMIVPCHRVVAVIGELRVEPPVQCRYQAWIRRRIDYLGAGFQFPVTDCDLAGLRSFQLGQSGHCCAVYASRAREIAFGKLCRDLPQVIAYQADLHSVAGIFHDNSLDAAHPCFCEYMGGCPEIERHDICTAFRNDFLPQIVRC